MARSDVQLMLDVKAGDDSSFELLLRKYRLPLVNFLYRMVRDAATAEDLAQEVFLRVYRARQNYAPSAKFTTWMFRIATNLALNSRRDGRHRQLEVSIDQPAEALDGEQPAFEVPDRRPSIERELMARDRAASILRAVEALPEKQRAAVLLHKYQEMDYDEIAKILQCSESALKSLLFRAYETLRVDLASLVETRTGRPGVRAGVGMKRKAVEDEVTMNCEQIEVSLIAYLDLKVTPAERRQVETHLAGCPTCCERAEQFRVLWSVLDELPVVSPSAAFDAKVRTLVAAEPKRAAFWGWLAPSPRLAFAVTLLVVFSVWLSSFSPARPPAAAVPQPGSEAEFRMIKDLPVLEDYDVLANFDALSDLPVQAEPAQRQSARPQL